MVHILYSYISCQDHPLLQDKLLPKYSSNFQNMINAQEKWEDAQLSLVGRELLLYGLKKMNKPLSESNIKYSKFGKPYFSNETLNFNISHAGKIVICVLIDGHTVGVDIEEKKHQIFNSFKSRMTKNEWEQIIQSDDQSDTFLTYWVRKEAVVKAHGQGLSIPLHSFEIINNKTVINKDTYYLKQIKIDPKYTCFIASTCDLESVPIQIQEIALRDLTQSN